MATTVAVLDDYQGVALNCADWGVLEGAAEVSVFREFLGDQDELVRALEPFEVIVAMRERTAFPADMLAALPNLRLLITTGMMNASIDVEAASAQGITVCGTSGLLPPTSELTWGLIHSLARNIPGEQNAMREGRWQVSLGTELSGHTLGILGLGPLGRRVARVALAFDMRVVAWSQNLTTEAAAEHGVEWLPKNDLLAQSDFVTIHMRLSDRSRGLVGAHELSLMKPTAYLINTSRGPIVDSDALVAALHARTIAGAGIDVYETEPLPMDHPLRAAPNTVLTPHIGYVARDTYEIFYTQAVEDIQGWLAGSPVRVIS